MWISNFGNTSGLFAMELASDSPFCTPRYTSCRPSFKVGFSVCSVSIRIDSRIVTPALCILTNWRQKILISLTATFFLNKDPILISLSSSVCSLISVGIFPSFFSCSAAFCSFSASIEPLIALPFLSTAEYL